MDSLKFITNHIFVIYIMIIIGVIAGKAKFLNDQSNISISKVLLNICLPLYIISAFNYEFSSEIIINLIIVFIFGLVIHPLCYILGLLIYRNKGEAKKNIYTFALMFSNCGYIGFPIIGSIYGNIGIIYGSIFLAPYNIFLWTIGVAMFNKQSSNKYSIFNPGVIAVFLGIVLFIFQIKLPFFLQKSITSVGTMTTPLSMLIIGSILSQIKIKEIFLNKSIYIVSFLRLIVIPLFTFISLIIFQIDNILIGICVLLVAMPVAVTLPILTQRYNSDTVLASKTVVISTLLSIITIPLIILFII